MEKKMIKRGNISIQMENPLKALFLIANLRVMEKCGSPTTRNTQVISSKVSSMEKEN